MKNITNQDVINSLRNLPEQQKVNIALEANIRGLNIEKDVVPVIANFTNAYAKIAETVSDNCKLLLGDNYKFLNK